MSTTIYEIYTDAYFLKGFKFIPLNKFYSGAMSYIKSDLFDMEREEITPEKYLYCEI